MPIITQEVLAESFIKSILRQLYDAFASDYDAHQNCISFDDYVWNRLDELGQSTYEMIGEFYGDLDDAAKELEL